VRGFPTPNGPPTYRNRYVKTQLGRLIDGPFLFTGSDTVVRTPLTPLLVLHCDIAAAPNRSRDTLPEQIWSEDQANLDAMGWQVREPYVNGGVIWYGGTSGSQFFADDWHHNWLANVEATGRYRDQPAMNHTWAITPKIEFQKLEHLWNAQIFINSSVVTNAVVWHTYSSTGERSSDWFSFCCIKVKPKRPLRPKSQVIRHMVLAKEPQIPEGSPFLWRDRLSRKLARIGVHLRSLQNSLISLFP
jgi:hypothetical protein